MNGWTERQMDGQTLANLNAPRLSSCGGHKKYIAYQASSARFLGIPSETDSLRWGGETVKIYMYVAYQASSAKFLGIPRNTDS